MQVDTSNRLLAPFCGSLLAASVSLLFIAAVILGFYPFQGYPYQDTARILLALDDELGSIFSVHNGHFIPVTKALIYLEHVILKIPPNNLGVIFQAIALFLIPFFVLRLISPSQWAIFPALIAVSSLPIFAMNAFFNVMSFGEFISILSALVALNFLGQKRVWVMAPFLILAATTHGTGWVFACVILLSPALKFTVFRHQWLKFALWILALPLSLLFSIYIVSAFTAIGTDFDYCFVLAAGLVVSLAYVRLLILEARLGNEANFLLLSYPILFAVMSEAARLDLSDIESYIRFNGRYGYWAALALCILIAHIFKRVRNMTSISAAFSAVALISMMPIIDKQFERMVWWEQNVWAPAMAGYSAGTAQAEVLSGIALHDYGIAWVAALLDRGVIEAEGVSHTSLEQSVDVSGVPICTGEVSTLERLDHVRLSTTAPGAMFLVERDSERIRVNANTFTPSGKMLGLTFLHSAMLTLIGENQNNRVVLFVDPNESNNFEIFLLKNDAVVCRMGF